MKGAEAATIARALVAPLAQGYSQGTCGYGTPDASPRRRKHNALQRHDVDNVPLAAISPDVAIRRLRLLR